MSRCHYRRSCFCAIAIVLFASTVVVATALAGEREQTLVVGMLSEPSTLNPLTVSSAEAADIVGRVFLKLLEERGDFLNFSPRLAREWRMSDDGLSITFELRDDVRWHDGVPVTADDVRFTWEVHTDTLVAWPHAASKKAIRDVEVLDSHTVTFHFSKRYRYQLMDAVDGVVLPKHILADVPREALAAHPFGRAPVGNGPYRFGRWETGQFIELMANPDYYEGAPVVERVLYRFVPDMMSLMALLDKGDVDALESIPADKARRYGDDSPVRLYTYPSRRMTYVVWNTQDPLFASAETRTALTMAINRAELIETLWSGFAAENKSPLHPILWAHDASIAPLPFDPGRAARNLAALGWKDRDDDGILENSDGKRFEFELIVNNNQLRIDAVTMIKAHLERVGVRANLRVMEFNTYVERILSGEFAAAYVDWKAQTKVDMTNDWHSASMPRDGFNISRYANAEVDAWIEEAREALDPEREKELWFKIQGAIAEDQPFTFVAIPQEINALHRRFCNVQPNAISFFANLRAWKLAPDCDP